MHLLVRWGAGLAVVVLLGCNAESAPTYHQHVKPFIDAKCGQCHAPDGVAPFALLTYEDVYGFRLSAQHAIDNRTMPPWPATSASQKYRYDYSLSEEERSIFAAWVAAGAPEGNPDRAAEPVSVEVPVLAKPDLRLEMPVAYEPDTSGPDDYRCFLIDWPEDEVSYVTGFKTYPGNVATVHHVIFYMAAPGDVELFQEYDDVSPGPGYPCFGSAVMTGEEDDLIPFGFVGGWAPGVSATLLPEGTGVKVEPGAKIIVQMHYNVLENSDPDLSAFEFQVADFVDKEGAYLLWMDYEWLYEDVMTIPAGGSLELTFEKRASRAESALFIPDAFGKVQGDYEVHAVLPHMHTLGKSLKFWANTRVNGHLDLVNIDRWDFNWQMYYMFAEPVLMDADDKLGLSCSWENTPERQVPVNGVRPDPVDVTWGDGTRDEMCLAFLYVTKQD